MVTPIGNRKQMEQQSFRNESLVSDSIFKAYLDKRAQLGMDKDPEGQQSSPTADPMADEAQAKPSAPPAGNSKLQDTMNQSQSLPGAPDEAGAAGGGGGFEDKVNQVVKSVLKGLQFNPADWSVTNSSTSNGDSVNAIKIDMKRVKRQDMVTPNGPAYGTTTPA